MEDYEYSEKEAEEMWIHQEEYLKAPLVKGWFRKYLDEIRKVSDDELLRRIRNSRGFFWSVYVDCVAFSLADLDYTRFDEWEAIRRTFLSREFKWRYEFALEKLARETRDKIPEIWKFWVLNPGKVLPEKLLKGGLEAA